MQGRESGFSQNKEFSASGKFFGGTAGPSAKCLSWVSTNQLGQVSWVVRKAFMYFSKSIKCRELYIVGSEIFIYFHNLSIFFQNLHKGLRPFLNNSFLGLVAAQLKESKLKYILKLESKIQRKSTFLFP